MLNELIARYPVLTACKNDITAARDALIACYEAHGTLLLCGNGGSCADCDHIVGELMKGFLLLRPLSEEQKAELKKNSPLLDGETLSKLQRGLPAVSLPSITALNSAFCNDVDPDLIYAQSVLAMGKKNDVLIAISTSGNAKNVCSAAKVAKGLGMKVIALTGEKGGTLREIADVTVAVPETETFKVQELHLPVYHYLCAAVEHHFFE